MQAKPLLMHVMLGIGAKARPTDARDVRQVGFGVDTYGDAQDCCNNTPWIKLIDGGLAILLLANVLQKQAPTMLMIPTR